MKPSVRTRYLSSIRNLNGMFSTLLIASIGTRDIADWVRDRKSGGKSSRKECGTDISNASIQRDLTALSRLMSLCCSIGWRTDNPVQSFDRTIIRERDASLSALQQFKIETVMQAAPAGVAGILGVLAMTGMRLAEAVNLERSQVDSKSQQILLTKTKTSRPRAIAWATPGGDATYFLESGRKQRLLYVSEATKEAYANFSSNVGQVQRRILKENPFFPRFGVHDLRHAFALRWLKSGGNIYRLSRHLGHSSVKVTEQNYLGYLTVEEQERVQLGSEQGAFE